MKNPLRKRLARELKREFGKYLVIFLFVAGIVSLISGFLVADDSMLAAYEESFEKYNIEDGNFELAAEGDDALIKTLEDEEVTIYKNYYAEEEVEGNDSTLRIFINREDVNKVSLMSGKFPENADEIAIDRMYADNNEIEVGDTITVAGEALKVSGLVALSDYSAMFSNNSDMMFDAVKFGVAVTTEERFEKFEENHIHYNYSWKYKSVPGNDEEEKEFSNDFLAVLGETTVIINYIPRYANQAIQFTGNDMGNDKAMFTTFLYIVIVIIAFVFAITTSNTISKEASIIGTLRASGYRKSELLRHYLAMPMLVMFVAAAIGNVLGYTIFKDFFASLYYGSYSLPTYITRFNLDALIRTTLVPMVIMFLINAVILIYKLQLSPLKFLRHDLRHKQKQRALRLSSRIKIFTRFRIRIIFQNISNYMVLFVGICFANFVILFGLLFEPLLDKYQDDIVNNMICDYQYVLKVPVETAMEGAEKFTAGELRTEEIKGKQDDITVYGIQEDSDYVNLDFDGDKIYISDGYAEKYNLGVGDQVTFLDSYGDGVYNFKIQGIYDYPSTLAIFMSQDTFNEEFENEKGYFNGYFSNQELTDIEDGYVATMITQDDLTKVSRQLDVSIGDMTKLFKVFGAIMSILLIYLLSKLVIEKNTQSISMVKILGFSNGEIGKLYVISTTIVVLLSLLISLPLCDKVMEYVFVLCLSDFSGWLPYYVAPVTYPKIFGIGAVCYAVVGIMQLYKIGKIPKSDALKNVE